MLKSEKDKKFVMTNVWLTFICKFVEKFYAPNKVCMCWKENNIQAVLSLFCSSTNSVSDVIFVVFWHYMQKKLFTTYVFPLT